MSSPRHAGGPERPVLPAAGWYMCEGWLRWWDGQGWTEHRVPPAPVYPVQRWRQAGMSGGEHMGHMVLTAMTCGMWLPVWVVIRIARGRRRTVPR
jgi:hypothetical protein